ncbi:hypothetical protein PVAND_004505 [Polypedilum vanderplanki]|uniref:RRM domain-containing protein n=1 Tax=Polypedilum vanderplanki TaxID=319348 RepID=A0A9J6BX64_POLVA|nr:hypothetical protein PVAND_004505 [Polypedilum vanderplanki]
MVGSRVYVGGLPYGTRERDLEKFFKGYGRTRDILIKNGYGFVEFEDYRDADDAVYELNGKELLGERVVVEPARGTARGSHRDRYDDRYGRRGGGGRYENSRNSSRYGPPLRTEYRLIVENLSSRVSWQDLKDYMRQAGEVTYADAHKQNRNEGVVEFASAKDMKTAIEKLDDTELNGRRIRLVEDTRRNGRGRGGARSSSSSRSRSRSRRRSRSRSRRSSRRSRDESRSKSRGSRSKSPVEKKKSRSNSRYSEKSRSRSRDSARSDSKRSNRDRNRSESNASDKGKSRSRDRSRSEDKNDKSRSRSRSRSGSVNNNRSPDRNESMED